MADDDKTPILWHELVDDAKINELAHELIQKFLSLGLKTYNISVLWDNEGRFISETRGDPFRRIEDTKPPEKH